MFSPQIASTYCLKKTIRTNDLFIECTATLIIQKLSMSDDKSFLKKYPKVEPGSHEWKLVEFKLQLSLGTSAVVVKKIFDISSTHLSSAFSSNAKGSIILESFMPT